MREPSASLVASRPLLRRLERERFFTPGGEVLVATGGGASSLGALSILWLARDELQLGAVGAVFVQREEREDDAAAEAGRLARTLGADFHLVEAPPGSDPLRVVSELARSRVAPHVVTGHTLEDAAERTLSQLLRGNGLRGLRPLAERRRDGLRRPLLRVDAATASQWARAAGIEPVLLPPEEAPRARRERALLRALGSGFPGAEEALRALAAELAVLRQGLRARATTGIVWRDGAIEIPGERVTALEALAQAGAARRALGLEGPRGRRVERALAEELCREGSRGKAERRLSAELRGSYLRERGVLRLRLSLRA